MNIKEGIVTIAGHDLKPYDTLERVKTILGDMIVEYHGWHGC
ncbi:hypothetical protein [Metabacillus bambusae]|nr:hypothetical protein [Metabacillus bambusae]